MNFKEKIKDLTQKRDEKILEMRKNKMTLQEIGNTFGITREAVRQILERKKEPVDKSLVNSLDK
jgi:DNA-directed RNA polymerase sigma subunit (sigma70/sigma32)